VRYMKSAVGATAVLLALVAVPLSAADGPSSSVDKGDTIDFESEPDPVSRTIVDPRSAVEPSEGHSVGSGVYEEPILSKAAVGCRTKVAWIGLKNMLGTFLWKYFQKLGWCWKRGEVTTATPRCRGTWAEVYFPLWDFKGHIGCDSSGGVGQSFVRRWRQGKFQLCAAWCIQTKTPWVNVRGSGTGVFSASYGM
jgi:hypothetical protein